MVQKVFGIREAKNGTEADELLPTATDGHQRRRHNVEKDASLVGWWGPSKGGKKLEN